MDEKMVKEQMIHLGKYNMIATPIKTTTEPIISNLSGLFLSIQYPQIIDDTTKIPSSYEKQHYQSTIGNVFTNAHRPILIL